MSPVVKKATSGFTLVDVLLSIAIITVGMVAVSYTMAVGIGLNIDTRETNLAYQAANAQMDYLRQLPFNRLSICTNQPFSVPNLSQLPNADARMTVELVQGEPNLKKVTLVISWTRRGPGRDQSIRLVTLVSRRGLNEKWQ
jgi:type II secretory pathway pseudopilin PulG